MDIKDLIEQFTAQLEVDGNTFTFYHGEKGWENLFADEATFPAVFLEEPITNDDMLHQSGLIQEKYNLKTLFLYKSELDFNPVEHKVLQAKARIAKNKMLSYFQASDLIKSIESSKTLEFINLFDANCSGVYNYSNVIPYSTITVCVP